MPLNDPNGALTPPEKLRRTLVLDSKSVAKVELRIGPDEVLEVSEDVAAQLVAADPHFRDPAVVPPKPEGVPEVDQVPDEAPTDADVRAVDRDALRAELKGEKVAALRARAEAEGIDPAGRSKNELVEAIVAAVFPE